MLLRAGNNETAEIQQRLRVQNATGNRNGWNVCENSRLQWFAS